MPARGCSSISVVPRLSFGSLYESSIQRPHLIRPTKHLAHCLIAFLAKKDKVLPRYFPYSTFEVTEFTNQRYKDFSERAPDYNNTFSTNLVHDIRGVLADPFNTLGHFGSYLLIFLYIFQPHKASLSHPTNRFNTVPAEVAIPKSQSAACRSYICSRLPSVDPAILYLLTTHSPPPYKLDCTCDTHTILPPQWPTYRTTVQQPLTGPT